MRAAIIPVLTLLLPACGDRTGLDVLVFDGPMHGSGGVDVGSGGALAASGGSASGGVAPASGGRPGAGGAPSSGGARAAGGSVSGGAPGAGGTRAAGGAVATGGFPAAGGMTAAGGSPADAGVGDAGPDYCAPIRELCMSAKICTHVMLDCGHLQSVDCGDVFHCAANEVCDHSYCVPK